MAAHVTKCQHYLCVHGSCVCLHCRSLLDYLEIGWDAVLSPGLQAGLGIASNILPGMTCLVTVIQLFDRIKADVNANNVSLLIFLCLPAHVRILNLSYIAAMLSCSKLTCHSHAFVLCI